MKIGCARVQTNLRRALLQVVEVSEKPDASSHPHPLAQTRDDLSTPHNASANAR